MNTKAGPLDGGNRFLFCSKKAATHVCNLSRLETKKPAELPLFWKTSHINRWYSACIFKRAGFVFACSLSWRSEKVPYVLLHNVSSRENFMNIKVYFYKYIYLCSWYVEINRTCLFVLSETFILWRWCKSKQEIAFGRKGVLGDIVRSLARSIVASLNER